MKFFFLVSFKLNFLGKVFNVFNVLFIMRLSVFLVLCFVRRNFMFFDDVFIVFKIVWKYMYSIK